jgi:hypothetical protein
MAKIAIDNLFPPHAEVRTQCASKHRQQFELCLPFEASLCEAPQGEGGGT